MRTITLLAKYNTALSIYVSLADAGTGSYKSSPTLAAGDVKCSQDGAAEANLGTLPAFDGTNTRQVLVTVAGTELDTARTRILFADQTSPKEWDDLEIVIETYGHASAAHPNLGWITGDAFARIGAPAGASVSADIAGVQSDTDNLQTRIPAALVSGRIDASVGAMAADVITAAAIQADAIGASELAADAVTELQAGLSTLDAAGVRAAVGLASANLDTQLDALPTNAELATALGTADDAVLAAIAALNNLSQANVRTAIGLASANLDTQLDALPTNAELATALGTADDAVLAAIAALNNLSQANIRTAVGLASADLDTQLSTIDGVVDAIKLKTDLIPADPADASDVAAGIAGLDAKLDTIDNFIDTEIAAILADTNELQIDWANGGRLDLLLDTAASGGSAPTAAEIADAVWDEAIAGHAAAGSTGEALSNAGAGGTPPTVGAIADGVWDELLSGHVAAGSAGKTLADILVDTAGIGAAEITVTSPVADGGDVSMIAGYDYTDDAERALEWESTSWPDLTGATVDVVKPELDEEDPPEEISYDWTVTVEDEGEATQRVKAEVSGAQTAELGTPGRTAKHRFRIKATLANSAQVVLVDATMTIT